MNNTPIDFVIIWVDGNDPEWRAEKAKYSPPSDSDDREERYRDWGLLPYWFRGVEKFAPWVNRIHFVTWGHLPKWLNTEHPKLNIVRHEDYIPEKYLPTFSSHTIELNLHRIKGLSENFVYFNDDMFITSPVSENIYFKKDIPCDSAVLNVHCYSPDLPIQMIAINDTGVINSHYQIKKTIRSAPFKWLNPLYGKFFLRTLSLMLCPRFPGFYQHHLPSALKKSTIEEVWKSNPDILEKTCMNKFRSPSDVNQWVFREWQLAGNNFNPQSVKGRSFFPDKNGVRTYDNIAKCICRQKYKMICINDCTMSDEQFAVYGNMIKNSFKFILPEKSDFEV